MSDNKTRVMEKLRNLETFQEGITLMELLFIMNRKRKLIVMTIILTAITGIVFSFSRPILYEAESTLMVSSEEVFSGERLGSEEILRNQRLVSTYSEIARSKSIMLNVIKKLDLETTPEEISKFLKMEPVEETELIKISYRDQNPQKAASLANEISEEFIKKISEVMTFKNLKIVEKAMVPEKSINDKKIIVAFASVILGALLGVFLALITEFLYGKLRKSEDIERILDCEILANLPKYNSYKEGDSNGS